MIYGLTASRSRSQRVLFAFFLGFALLPAFELDLAAKPSRQMKLEFVFDSRALADLSTLALANEAVEVYGGEPSSGYVALTVRERFEGVADELPPTEGFVQVYLRSFTRHSTAIAVAQDVPFQGPVILLNQDRLIELVREGTPVSEVYRTAGRALAAQYRTLDLAEDDEGDVENGLLGSEGLATVDRSGPGLLAQACELAVEAHLLSLEREQLWLAGAPYLAGLRDRFERAAAAVRGSFDDLDARYVDLYEIASLKAKATEAIDKSDHELYWRRRVAEEKSESAFAQLESHYQASPVLDEAETRFTSPGANFSDERGFETYVPEISQ